MTALATTENGHALATVKRATVLGALSERYSMDPVKLLDTIKATCIKGQASNEQVQAFLIVANRYGLDPFLKQIHAFADRGGGIVPIVGIDGWTKIINEQDRFDGMEEPKYTDDKDGRPQSCTVTIYVKGRSHPVTITEFYAECKRDTPPWKQYPRRMLRHRALMQCARIAFGLGGLYDEDEARDIINNNDPAPATSAAVKSLEEKFAPAPKASAPVHQPAPAEPEVIDPPADDAERQREGGGNIIGTDDLEIANLPDFPTWDSFHTWVSEFVVKSKLDIDKAGKVLGVLKLTPASGGRARDARERKAIAERMVAGKFNWDQEAPM